MTEDTNNRLEALQDRRRTIRVTSTHKTYSSIIKKLRWVLPVLVLTIVAALLVWPKIEIEISQKRFAPAKLDREALQKAATENKLADAKFSSVDAKGRPFTIIAAEAVQDSKNPDIINLIAPSGTLQLNGDASMTAISKTGSYQQKDQLLYLKDDVVFTRSDGTAMKTSVMYIDLMANTARTNQPVIIDGPQGTLKAQAMDMQNGGAVTIFKGPATLRLHTNNSINPKGGNK